jgi:hypothetical protein
MTMPTISNEGFTARACRIVSLWPRQAERPLGFVAPVIQRESMSCEQIARLGFVLLALSAGAQLIIMVMA